MKTSREQISEELRIINLFASNYARDLLYYRIKFINKIFVNLYLYTQNVDFIIMDLKYT